MKKRLRKKLLIGSIVALVVVFILFFMPLPFISTLWQADIFRHRMDWDVWPRVVGLHQEQITSMLGTPEDIAFASTSPAIDVIGAGVAATSTWGYRIDSQRSLIISFDEDGFAIHTVTGHPDIYLTKYLS